MKKLLLTISIAILFALIVSSVIAQSPPASSGYQFKTIKKWPATSIKNQYRSSTCWSFSVLSMLESELLRMNKGEYDLSEMFVVRHTYNEKAIKYVRLHGKINFAGGGFGHDVLHVMKTYGMVPEEVYTGLNIGEDNHTHNEMDEVLKGFVEGVVKNKNRKLSPVWHDGFVYTLDSYLGPIPEQFEYNGTTYTPESFANSLDLKLDDYIQISSFTHHPYYEEFILEVPDNWAWGKVTNVPLDELLEIMFYAIDKGYTLVWSADNSDMGFSWNSGVAIVPDVDLDDLTGTEREKWEELPTAERTKLMYSFSGPVPERNITQDIRQEAFDNYTTTDDHGMHITGVAEDQEGNKYFIVKNSWGLMGSPFEGYIYASDAFVRYNTIAIMVNKNALPDKIREKLDLD